MSCPYAGNTTPREPSSGQGGANTDNISVARLRELTELVRVPEDISSLYALPVQPHHVPYHSLIPSHLKRMNGVLRALSADAGGSTVEHGIIKAKRLLEDGENPDLIRHALGIYLTHSRDAQKRRIIVPPLKHHAFMSTPTLAASAATTIDVVGGQVVIPDTLRGQAILSYWREDYDFNDHHLHWHYVFPGTGTFVDGQQVRVIDRQGELFLYMHSQMVTRYETEGICWNLPLVRPWNQYDDVLEEGYVPMPGFIFSYGGHPPFSSWYATKNPNVPDVPHAVAGPGPRALLEKWRDNIYQGINEGAFWTKNEVGDKRQYKLTPDNCTNMVGVVVEAELAPLQKLDDGYSIDDEVYGSLHNMGHVKFAEMSYGICPTETAQFGLMITDFGGPRDTAFWPWHKHVQYFGRLAAARFPQDLTEHRAAVTLKNLSIVSQKKTAVDGLTTFLGPPASNLMESLAKLDHEPYKWSVEITSTLNPPPTPAKPQTITLRFFIAAQQLVEDYHNWIEMDKVTVTITSATAITNVRLDKQSSVARKMGNYSEMDPQYASAWCRCGWPQNLMLPVGKVDGAPFVGFCMATDDKVSEDIRSASSSYCGALTSERKYPDPRGMGYPFNQVWKQLLDGGPNRSKLSDVIKDTKSFPFLTTTEFKIYRTTKLFLDKALNPGPPVQSPTWYDPIKGYFKPRDMTCMIGNGVDLSNYEDVVMRSKAIYDSTVNKRMPLQMSPFTQENPDPKYPMWTDAMCENFRAWILNGCPKGEPRPPPPPPPTDATWEKPIKGYFLPADVKCMKGSINLADHDSVKNHAEAIYDAVSNKRMPLQMSPYTQDKPDPNHPMWTKDMCDTFKAWMDNGCP